MSHEATVMVPNWEIYNCSVSALCISEDEGCVFWLLNLHQTVHSSFNSSLSAFLKAS